MPDAAMSSPPSLYTCQLTSLGFSISLTIRRVRLYARRDRSFALAHPFSLYASLQEEKLKGKQGYEHLSEPLHLLIEAELPEDIINSRLEHSVHFLESLLKPMDESMDHYKREQLKELAAINGTLREESPSPSLSPCLSPSMSPFNSKRAKTGQ
ncbi:hypothetical protein F2Q68_00013120 [Brassica cretica]|uniref:KH domain-containing protein n=1 Tax=Brassica cretica TaxID=69181 RepID=A0A8S9HGR8_BRACR|nr:hypothetical protein F2Q68_00013120 [Brassica cretica]